MADISIKVQEQTFRGHESIIAASSPKLAKMIRKNLRILKIQIVASNHFRRLLEIICVGNVDKRDNVDDILRISNTNLQSPDVSFLGLKINKNLDWQNEVNFLSTKIRKDVEPSPRELQVYSDVTYCTNILGGLIDATTACQVLDFALQTSDKDLEESCIKVIREQTDAVLKSVSFINCNVASLQVILSQEIVHAVTELDLFLACALWAETRKNPRQALGSALSLIRFRVLTVTEYVQFVVPSKLLTAEEEKILTLYFLTGEEKMPEGFSNEQNERQLFLEKEMPEGFSNDQNNTQLFVENSKMVVGMQEEIYLNFLGDFKYMTLEQINACPPLRFSVNSELNLIGVKVWSDHEGKKLADKYTEDVVVTLQDKNGKVIASAGFCEEFHFIRHFYVRFSSPVPIDANTTYTLHYITMVPSVRHYTAERVQQTYKSESNVEIRLLQTVFSPIISLIIES